MNLTFSLFAGNSFLVSMFSCVKSLQKTLVLHLQQHVLPTLSQSYAYPVRIYTLIGRAGTSEKNWVPLEDTATCSVGSPVVPTYSSRRKHFFWRMALELWAICRGPTVKPGEMTRNLRTLGRYGKPMDNLSKRRLGWRVRITDVYVSMYLLCVWTYVSMYVYNTGYQ